MRTRRKRENSGGLRSIGEIVAAPSTDDERTAAIEAALAGLESHERRAVISAAHFARRLPDVLRLQPYVERYLVAIRSFK